MDASQPKVAELYRQWHRYVFRLLLRLSIPERDVEDLVHEVFIVVQRKLHTFEPRLPIKPWIAGITYRVAYGYRRTSKNRCELLVEELPEPLDLAFSPETSAMYAEGRELVFELLDRVSLKRRIVLIMHDLDKIGARQIMQALDLPEGTVRRRLDEARREFVEAAERMNAAEERRGARNIHLAPFFVDPDLLLAAERQIPDLPGDVGARLWDRLCSTLEDVSATPPYIDTAPFTRAPMRRLFSTEQVAAYVGGAFMLGAGAGALVYALMRQPPPPPVPAPVEESPTMLAVYHSTPAPTPWPSATTRTSTPISSASVGATVKASPVRTLAAKAPAPPPKKITSKPTPSFAAERMLLQHVRDAQKRGDERTARALLEQYEGQFPHGELNVSRVLAEHHEKPSVCQGKASERNEHGNIACRDSESYFRR